MTSRHIQTLCAAILMLTFAATLPAIAMEHGEGTMKDKKMMAEGKDMPMKKAPMMKMRGMLHAQMIASTDGSVVILTGKTLLKYDSNLELVKKTEIEISPMGMGKSCPMCEKMEDKKETKEHKHK